MRKCVLPPGEASYKELYCVTRCAAKNRNLIFDISFEQFKELIIQNCQYCGKLAQPFNKYVSKKGKINRQGKNLKSLEAIERAWIKANGIDRMDNDIGYKIENCTPCCEQCNRAKLQYSIKEFLDHAKKIVEHNNLIVPPPRD